MDDMNILVINCGSSSIKYQLRDVDQETVLHKDVVELQQGSYESALNDLLKSLTDKKIDAVGHRVVHGGEHFADAVVIDDKVIAAIESCVPMAPLHNPSNLAGIHAAMGLFPSIPHIAVFDTAFHASLPRRASTYALDTDLAKKHGIRRYGFHGTSHNYVALQAASYLGRPLSELKIVSLHLGNGASACAIEHGHSTETSMGMTPLEGLVMGTRAGDIDAGAVMTILREEEIDVEALDELLNRQAGLKGLSGVSNDVREIETHAEQGHDRSRLAIAVFAHRVKKYIGAYAATMGGIDAIILTGGIGENSATIRQRVLQRLDFLGLQLDEDRNNDVSLSSSKPTFRISSDLSGVHALVIKTNEELMIARQTQALVQQQARSNVANSPAIPIAVSARHCHLDKETFAILFGADATPTHHADLSQPGQYACKEKINLIGPRNQIDGVRLLGPLRSKNQIEISRTDEFVLGVDAPVRDSGRVKGSAPITIEGPAGRVHLEEGLICARRHIHMHTDDAKRFDVKNKDEVEVAITGGPRDLIFCDVLVRVSPGYKLEMHIDTDEANAAELSRHSNGELVYDTIPEYSAEFRSKRSS